MPPTATQVLSALMVVIGLAMVVRTLAEGGGPGAAGLWLGVLLCALGVGRLVVSRHG